MEILIYHVILCAVFVVSAYVWGGFRGHTHESFRVSGESFRSGDDPRSQIANQRFNQSRG